MLHSNLGDRSPNSARSNEMNDIRNNISTVRRSVCRTSNSSAEMQLLFWIYSLWWCPETAY